jgi:hypothetical protein
VTVVGSYPVIDWLKALATPAIAVAGVVIAVGQLRIANVRLTHDLFDRRYIIYTAARKFIQEICQKLTVTIEERSSFVYASADAVFVLDRGLAAYLEELRVKAVQAAGLHDKIGSGSASQAEIEERTRLANWFSTQINALTENFKPFLQHKKPWPKRYLTIVVITLVALVFLLFPLFIGRGTAENPSPQPTATEVFHLRSECAALGEKIPTSPTIAPGITASPISHYEPRTNRCYVVLNTVDAPKPFTHASRRYLFDGQTGEMLAYTEVRDGEKSAAIGDKRAGWDEVSQYIDTMMADDRKQ